MQWVQLPDGRWISEKDPGYPFLAAPFQALGIIRLAPLFTGRWAAWACSSAPAAGWAATAGRPPWCCSAPRVRLAAASGARRGAADRSTRPSSRRPSPAPSAPQPPTGRSAAHTELAHNLREAGRIAADNGTCGCFGPGQRSGEACGAGLGEPRPGGGVRCPRRLRGAVPARAERPGQAGGAGRLRVSRFDRGDNPRAFPDVVHRPGHPSPRPPPGGAPGRGWPGSRP